MTSKLDNSAPAPCSGCMRSPKYKQDFPIEWEGDHYVSRREMVKFLTLGSVLLAISNWVVAFSKRLVRRQSDEVKLLGSAATLAQNGSILFRYPSEDSPCIAVRTPEGRLVGYSQVCTHLSCAVVYDKPANQLVCPCHRGVFDVNQGAPVAGPPTRALPRVKLEQRGDQISAVGWEA